MMKTVLPFLLLLALPVGSLGAEASPGEITVYRSLTCGCCKDWIAHLEEEGFRVKDMPTANMSPVKSRFDVPAHMQSCHTAVIDGYVVEGHVPAADIRRLLQERPDVAGIAVPGMPVGSPGMEMGDRVDPYNVMTFTDKGVGTVFQSYSAD